MQQGDAGRRQVVALIPQMYAIALAYGINPAHRAAVTRRPLAGPQRHRLAPPQPAVGALGDKVRPSTSWHRGRHPPRNAGSTSRRCGRRATRRPTGGGNMDPRTAPTTGDRGIETIGGGVANPPGPRRWTAGPTSTTTTTPGPITTSRPVAHSPCGRELGNGSSCPCAPPEVRSRHKCSAHPRTVVERLCAGTPPRPAILSMWEAQRRGPSRRSAEVGVNGSASSSPTTERPKIPTTSAGPTGVRRRPPGTVLNLPAPAPHRMPSPDLREWTPSASTPRPPAGPVPARDEVKRTCSAPSPELANSTSSEAMPVTPRPRARLRCPQVGVAPIPRAQHPPRHPQLGSSGPPPTRQASAATGRRTPAHGVCIATGAESGLWALDIDPGHGGDDSLRALEAVHGDLPDTVQSLTGGGGVHHLFAWPDDGREILNNQSGRAGAGIDVRGVGGQVVVAPTIHPTAPRTRGRWSTTRSTASRLLRPRGGWSTCSAPTSHLPNCGARRAHGSATIRSRRLVGGTDVVA